MPKALTLPGYDDVRQLPRWSRVALAAKVARRVQPRFALEWTDATSRHLQIVDRAIELAELGAKECYESDHPFVAQMQAASQACEKLAAALIEPAPGAAWVALCAARAVDAAQIACKGNRLLIVDHTLKAIEAAVESSGLDAVLEGIHRDWQKLAKNAKR